MPGYCYGDFDIGLFDVQATTHGELVWCGPGDPEFPYFAPFTYDGDSADILACFSNPLAWPYSVCLARKRTEGGGYYTLGAWEENYVNIDFRHRRRLLAIGYVSRHSPQGYGFPDNNQYNDLTFRLYDGAVLVWESIGNSWENLGEFGAVERSLGAGVFGTRLVVLNAEESPYSEYDIWIGGMRLDMAFNVPIANNDVDTCDLLGSVDVDVLANDEFPDFPIADDGLTIVGGYGPYRGSVEVKGTGASQYVTYTNTSGTAGQTDSFRYKVTDTEGQYDTATVTITLTSLGGIDAVDDYAECPLRGRIMAWNVLANDELNYPLASLEITSQPTRGEVQVVGTLPNKLCNYRNLSGSVGQTDSFVYTITDSMGQSDSATAHITLISNPDLDEPTANDDAMECPVGGFAWVKPLTNDVLPYPLKLIELIAEPTKGTGRIDWDGTFLYENTSGEADDTDQAEYRITDINDMSDTAYINITLVEGGPGPEPPAGKRPLWQPSPHGSLRRETTRHGLGV